MALRAAIACYDIGAPAESVRECHRGLIHSGLSSISMVIGLDDFAGVLWPTSDFGRQGCVAEVVQTLGLLVRPSVVLKI